MLRQASHPSPRCDNRYCWHPPPGLSPINTCLVLFLFLLQPPPPPFFFLKCIYFIIFFTTTSFFFHSRTTCLFLHQSLILCALCIFCRISPLLPPACSSHYIHNGEGPIHMQPCRFMISGCGGVISRLFTRAHAPPVCSYTLT